MRKQLRGNKFGTAFDAAAVLLVVAGLALLATRFLPTRAAPAGERNGQRETLNFALDRVVPPHLPRLAPGGMTAVFVLHHGVCAACLSEVADWEQVLASAAPTVVPGLVLVLDDEVARGRRLLATAQLPFVGVVAAPSTASAPLTRFGSDTSRQQLVFLDRSRDRLVYRTLLPSTVTPRAHKRRVLAEALAAARVETVR